MSHLEYESSVLDWQGSEIALLVFDELTHFSQTMFFYLMSRNRTWTNFGGGVREVFNPVLGGAMWMGAIAIYGSATTYLGVLGVSIGWALFQILIVLTGNLAGVLTGEWRQVEARIFRANAVGVGVLFVAIMVIGAANYYAR